MASIHPSVVPNTSLSSPLITPGYPLAAVEKSSPVETANGKMDGTSPSTRRANVIHNSGHDSDRLD